MQTKVKDPKESTRLVVIDLNVEELEEVIAPQGLVIPRSTLRNHNETLVGEIELNVEELEEVIAPAFTSFLSFGDIKGESIDKEHRDYN